jgi:hypothetical protein
MLTLRILLIAMAGPLLTACEATVLTSAVASDALTQPPSLERAAKDVSSLQLDPAVFRLQADGFSCSESKPEPGSTSCLSE